MKKYAAVVVSRSKHIGHPSFKGNLYENGVLIGSFRRGLVSHGYVQPITYKFRSDASRDRFASFADSESIEECIEALVGFI